MGIIISERIPSQPPSIHRVIVAVVVVDEAQFGVVVFAGPLDGWMTSPSAVTSP